jgi:hypothetical protein
LGHQTTINREKVKGCMQVLFVCVAIVGILKKAGIPEMAEVPGR